MKSSMDQKRVVIDYTNYKGERADRMIEPLHLWFGLNVWHNAAQWFVCARAVDRGGDHRMFALNKIHSWRKADAV